jgi:hypothetical protein
MDVPNSEMNGHEEAWDEDEDYDEDDEDIDAEAQEIARRLGEELWAAIKANAERNAPSVPNSSVIAAEPQVGASLNEARAADNASPTSPSRKEDLAIRTMLAILTLVDNDPLAKSTLVSTFIPNGSNVLEVLKQCTTSGSIAKDIAGPLSQILVTLAGSDTLFGKLKHSNAPAIKLDKDKRNRENFDEGQHVQSHAYKRPRSAHQRSHSTHRPFRCSACPASFARNHDLQRHLKLHDKTAWRCEGCNKVFSRRDAIKRHQTGIKNRGPKSEICLVAEVTEVQLGGEDGEDSIREERRAKLWNGIAMNEANDTSASDPQTTYNTNAHVLEEGEINPTVIAGIQAAIMSLHGRLQTLVGGALGVSMNHPVSMPVDPSTGQATLASVIACAQSSNLPSSTPVVGAPTPGDGTATNTPSVNLPVAGENSLQAQTLGENLENHIPLPSLSMYGLSDEQTHLLEIAIANAASAAQAQAEAEAALEEEEEEDYDQDDYDQDESEMEQDQEQ